MDAEIDLFMNYLSVERNAAENTMHAYRIDLHQFTEYLSDGGDEPAASDVVQADIRGFMDFLWDDNAAKSTIERKLASKIGRAHV